MKVLNGIILLLQVFKLLTTLRSVVSIGFSSKNRHLFIKHTCKLATVNWTHTCYQNDRCLTWSPASRDNFQLPSQDGSNLKDVSFQFMLAGQSTLARRKWIRFKCPADITHSFNPIINALFGQTGFIR